MSSFFEFIIVELLDGVAEGRIKYYHGPNKCVAYKIQIDKLKDTLLDKTKAFVELSNLGVYLLIGSKENEMGIIENTVYVGKSNDVRQRYLNHSRLKSDDIQECIIFTVSDNSLTEGETSFIEHELYAIAKKCNRYTVTNGNEPSYKAQDYEKQIANNIIGDICRLTSTLGHNIFEVLPTKKSVTIDNIFYIKSELDNVEAIVVRNLDGYTIQKGAIVSRKEPILEVNKKRREDLIEKKIIENYIFTKEYLFKYPSSVANVILGGNWSGNEVLKLKDGKTTLGMLRAKELDIQL